MKIHSNGEEVQITTPQNGNITITSDPDGKSLRVDFFIEGEKKYYRVIETNPPKECGEKPGLQMRKR